MSSFEVPSEDKKVDTVVIILFVVAILAILITSGVSRSYAIQNTLQQTTCAASCTSPEMYRFEDGECWCIKNETARKAVLIPLAERY